MADMFFNTCKCYVLSVCPVVWYIVLVSCPAGLALMRKHRLVTMLEFLGPGSVIQPKYWLANQNRGVA